MSIEFFNERAKAGNFDSYTEEQRSRLLMLLDDVQFPIGEPIKALDCGCGTGRAMEVLAERLGKGAEIVGVDSSPAMIERAKELRRVPDGVTFDFHVADCKKLPFEAETFDWVVVIDTFPHFGDFAAAIAGIRRVLKDGGFLAILEHHSVEDTNRHHREIGGPVANDCYLTRRNFRDCSGSRGCGCRYISTMGRDSGRW